MIVSPFFIPGFLIFQRFTIVKWGAFIAFGAAVIATRNLEVFTHPIFFAEDGVWLGNIFEGNWTKAYLENRSDYLTIVQVALLHFSYSIVQIFFGGNLLYLPAIIGINSSIVWSIAGVVAYVSLRPSLDWQWRAIICGFIWIMPLPEYTQIIIGRVLNLGYILLPVQFFLSLIYLRSMHIAEKSLVALASVSLMLTNPLCIPVVFTTCILDAMYKTGVARAVTLLLLAASSSVSVFYFIRIDFAVERHSQTYNFDTYFEVIVSRSILYPFISAFYQSMNHAIAGVLIACLIVGLVYAFRSLGRSARLLLLALLGLAIFATAFVIQFRPWILQSIYGYRRTFPDQYYISQNILWMVGIIFVLSSFPGTIQRVTKTISVGILVASVPLSYGYGAPELDLSFRGDISAIAASSLKQLECLSDADIVEIPSYPSGWSMNVRVGQLRRTVEGESYNLAACHLPY